MKKKSCCLLVFVSIAISAIAQTLQPGYEDGKIWFKMKDGAPELSRLPAARKQLSLQQFTFLGAMKKGHRLKGLERPFALAKKQTPLLQTFTLSFENFGDVDKIIAELVATGLVEYAEKVPLCELSVIPNDFNSTDQPYLNKINAPAAWNYSTGSNSIIAIVDDAFEITHPDLAPNLWVNPDEIPGNGIDDDGNGYIDDIHGASMMDNSGDPNPPPGGEYRHGTQTAGAASGATNNGIGIASIGYNCKLMCVRSADAPGSISHGFTGILYAADNGAHVISCSWSTPSYSATGQYIIDYARERGAIVVGSAGNYSNNTKRYPGAYTGVVSVAATNIIDRLGDFSSYGNWITVCAPGVGINTTFIYGQYVHSTGTSFAAPMVAGLLGLMRSMNPVAPADELINCLKLSAVNIDALNPSRAGMLGAGRINAEAALQLVQGTLSHLPVPEFSSDFTTGSVGARVTFTDHSYYGPVGYQWEFPGGTPSSHTGKIPPVIVYNTAGNHDVVLTVSNANGSAVNRKSAYITVNPVSACNAVRYPVPANWDSINYFLGSTDGMDGWLNGVNVFRDQQKAMYYDITATPASYITKVRIGFGRGYSADPAKIVPVHVFDGTSGSPGALLGSAQTTMGQIMQDVQNKQGTMLDFKTAIRIPTSNRFFVSVDLRNLCWDDNCKDTLSIYAPQPDLVNPSPIWEMSKNGIWRQYGSADSWPLLTYLYIHPYLTNEPAVSVFTNSADNICNGGTVRFNAAGSTFQDGLVWSFPGGTPGTVSGQVNPEVVFNTTGPQEVNLTIKGGGCHDTRSFSKIIQVNAYVTPAVQISGRTPGGAGSPATITAIAQQAGDHPQYEFMINDISMQVGSATTFTTAALSPGDKVACILYPDLECITATSVVSNLLVAGPDGSLPLKLLYFRGRVTSSGNVLSWRTASELNTASFIVERSHDNIHFGKTGMVQAAGESQVAIDYSFTDVQSFTGVVFYRLRMMDVDGSSILSPVIYLEEKPHATGTLKVWPQPVAAGALVNVRLTGNLQGRIIVRIANSTGQVVRSHSIQSRNGVYQAAINTHSLSRGLYFIQCYNSNLEIVGRSKLIIE